MAQRRNGNDRPDSADGLRVLFAGGGTGGHLIPGAAVAEALRMMLPSSRCMFLVTRRKAEVQCHPAIAQFEKAEVPSTPWAGVVRKVCFPFRSVRSARRVVEVISAFRPHAVVGLGGCNSVVPIAVARLLGIATAVLEANAIPGRACRALAPLAHCVAVQWKEAAAHMTARRVIETGNPIRLRALGLRPEAARRRLGLVPDRCTLLALGGSQGALALNEALIGALHMLHERRLDIQVLHLTGMDHLHMGVQAQQQLAMWYRPIGFLDKVEEAYAAADLAFCRAGSSTLAYLTALGVPSVLVPLPHAADNHQEANADVLARSGAAIVIQQSDLTRRRLADLIERLALSQELRRDMARRARALGKPRAALRMAAVLAELAGFSSRIQPVPGVQTEERTRYSQAA